MTPTAETRTEPAMPVAKALWSEVTDVEIEEAFRGTDFGNAVPRELLALSVLKIALRYHCGSTITSIMLKMGLTTAKGRVTERGRQFCYRQLKMGRSG